VVKVRTFTAPPNSPAAHRGVWSGSLALYREEGLRGLYRGTTLALVGVSNGALQFMAYEKMKSWAFERRRRRLDKLGRAWTMEDDKLVKTVLAALLFLYAHPHRKQRKLTFVLFCFFRAAC
jgi:solute carrier family 25 folate transporter 32